MQISNPNEPTVHPEPEKKEVEINPNLVLVTLADLQGFFQWMEASSGKMGDTRSMLIYFIEYLEKTAKEQGTDI